MPMPIFEGLFTRPWKFVDRALRGDAALRSDFDVQLDDFANALNTSLGGGITFVGEWDASSGEFPLTRPDGSPIRLRDAWAVSAGGTVSGVTFAAGNTLIALQLPPGETYEDNWLRVELATIGALAASLDEINVQVAAAQSARAGAETSEQAAAGHAATAGQSLAQGAGHAAAAQSYANAANNALLNIGVALLQDLGAFTVNADGDLIATYAGNVIQAIAINADGNLLITYEV